MVTSPATPPEGVTDADWVEQHSSTDPFEDVDAAAAERLQHGSVEADDADLAEQDVVVPLDDEEE